MTPLSKMIWLRRLINLVGITSTYLLSRMTHRVIHLGKPAAVSIEPTNHCNLSCPECPSGRNELKRARGHMDPVFFRSIIDQLSPQLTYLTLYFQGEPYLDPNFFESIRYARSKKIYVSTSTNGHFFSQENIVQTISSGLNRLIISLDGTNQEAYASYRIGGNFEKVTEGIRQLVSIKKERHAATPLIILQFLVLKTNQHQIREIKMLGKQLRVDKVELKTAQFNNYQFGHPLMPDILKYSRYTLSKSALQHHSSPTTYQHKNHFPNACFRMWSSCVLTWDGIVVPCCYDKHAEHALGDMTRQSFQTIWKSPEYDSFRLKILKNRKSVPICMNCSQRF